MRRPLPVLAFGIALAVLFAHPAAAACICGVTAPPSLVSPVASTTYGHSLAVQYVLTDPPLAGSVRLIFSGSASCSLTMDNAQTPTFTLDTTNPAASGNVVSSTCGSIADGTYTVTVAYQDVMADPTATAVAAGVVIQAPPATTTTTTTTSTTTTTTTTTTLLPTSTTPATTSTVPVVANAALAATAGSATAEFGEAGVGLLLAGTALVAVSRRRRR